MDQAPTNPPTTGMSSEPAASPPEPLPVPDDFEMHRADLGGTVGEAMQNMLDAISRNLAALEGDPPAHRKRRIAEMQKTLELARPFTERFLQSAANKSITKVMDTVKAGKSVSPMALIPVGIDLIGLFRDAKKVSDTSDTIQPAQTKAEPATPTRSAFDLGLLG